MTSHGPLDMTFPDVTVCLLALLDAQIRFPHIKQRRDFCQLFIAPKHVLRRKVQGSAEKRTFWVEQLVIRKSGNSQLPTREINARISTKKTKKSYGFTRHFLLMCNLVFYTSRDRYREGEIIVF
jgi:hypothetical protein